MEPNVQIKCRQCRTLMTKLPADCLLDSHSDKFVKNHSQIQSNCPSIIGRTEVYLNEDALESWIQDEIAKSEWTKGKLKCTKCTANVGSFDFVAGQKCECRQFNQPSVHFICSKIDMEDVK